MQTVPLIFDDGHLFVDLDEGSLLLDTGAPTSFGKVSPIMLDKLRFDLAPSYMGLDAGVLSNYVGRATSGILGGNILNRFDVLV